MEQCWHAVVTEQMGKKDITPEAMQALDLFLLGLLKSNWEGEEVHQKLLKLRGDTLKMVESLGNTKIPSISSTANAWMLKGT